MGRSMAFTKRTSSAILWMRLVGHLKRSVPRNWASTMTVLKKGPRDASAYICREGVTDDVHLLLIEGFRDLE